MKDAWEKLKELVASIKPDKDYECDKCELEPYCKWCPARGWLENRNFISCEPESRRWAEGRKQKSEVRRQKTENRSQKTEDRSQKTEDRSQKTEDRRQKTEDREQRTEATGIHIA